jgi:AraC family transcriptional regulator
MIVKAPERKRTPEKKLVGMRIRTSLSENRTFELWHGFMPRRKVIVNRLSDDLVSMRVYDTIPDFTDAPERIPFNKWAAAEVADFENVPEGMEAFTIREGLYAVFIHKGDTEDAARDTFRYIYATWLPGSGYLLDDRPHFEILGAKYKRNDPDSEEEVWIPVKNK